MTAAEELHNLLHYPSASLSQVDRALQTERALEEAIAEGWEAANDADAECSECAKDVDAHEAGYAEGFKEGKLDMKRDLHAYLKTHHPEWLAVLLLSGVL